MGRPVSICRTAPFSTCRQLATSAVTAQEGSSSSDCGSKSSYGAISAGSQERVAAALARASLDSTELQQQRPEEYSRLTLPLAQVLAEVHTARGARAVSTLTLQPADLLARINFLAYEVGLTVNGLNHVLQRQLKFVLFHLESARDLLHWLRAQHVSIQQLQLASRGLPNFLVGGCKEAPAQQAALAAAPWYHGQAVGQGTSPPTVGCISSTRSR